MNIQLGDKVCDKLTGFEGIASAKVEYLNGYIFFCVTPLSTDGKYNEGHYIDCKRLDVIGNGWAHA